MAVDSGLDVKQFVKKNTEGYLESVVRRKRLDRVQRIADLIEDGDCILTHCNVSGELAMAAYLLQESQEGYSLFRHGNAAVFSRGQVNVLGASANGRKCHIDR